jgi:hypothetical protein
MGNLIKMDLLKIRKIKITYVAFLVMVIYDLLINIAAPLLFKMIGSAEIEKELEKTIGFSSLVGKPTMTMMMFFAVTAFSYMDIANGYIKNIAGQLANKGNVVISKLTAASIYCLIFMIISGVVNAFTSCVCYKVTFDIENLPLALCTLLIKWMLAMGLCAIFVFFTNGIKSNVAAYIIVALLSTGAAGAAYMGIDLGLHKLGISESFTVNDYAPDMLFDSVDVINGELVANGIIVAIVCFILFTFLGVSMFNKKDVK